MKRFILTGLVTLALSVAPSRALGFGEDICFKDGVLVDPQTVNTPQRPAECDPALGEVSDTCASLANANMRSAKTVKLNGCYSSTHFYGTYLAALLSGFDAEAAYLISAYNETTDFTVYTHYDLSGRAMPGRTTATLNGIARTNTNTLGDIIHMPLPNQTTPHPGREIHPDSPNEEPMLAQLYAWSLGKSNQFCAGAITTPNKQCYTGNLRTSLAPQAFTYLASLTEIFIPSTSQPVSLPGYTGDQVFQYTDSSSLSAPLGRPQSPIYNEGLAGLVGKAGTYRGGPVPVALAKLGVFTHALGDRYSHQTCLDDTVVTQKLGVVTFPFEHPYCTVKHVGAHLQEIGYSTLPSRTTESLNAGLRFMDTAALTYPGFAPYAPITGSARNALMQGLFAALKQPTACRRVQAFTKLLSDYRLPQLPGYSYQPSLCL